MIQSKETERKEDIEKYREDTKAWGYTARLDAAIKKLPDKAVADFASMLEKNNARDVLDLACGNCRNSAFLAGKGYNITGVDSSPQALEIAREISKRKKLGNLHIILGLGTKIPAGDARFDAVISNLLLDELGTSERKRVICEVERVLKPSGLAFVTGFFTDADARVLENSLCNFNLLSTEKYADENKTPLTSDSSQKKFWVFVAEKKAF